MRHEREDMIAMLQGMLTKHRIPTTDKVFETVNTLKTESRNMDSGHLGLILALVEQAMNAKAKAVKEAAAQAIAGLEV